MTKSFLNVTSSKKQGDVGLATAILWFAENNYTVCIPLTDSQDYDLVVENNNKLFRVQVKTVLHQHRGLYKVQLRTRSSKNGKIIFRSFDKSMADMLFIVTESKEKYLIPTAELTAFQGIALSAKYDKFKV
jgi:hypothetical protein